MNFSKRLTMAVFFCLTLFAAVFCFYLPKSLASEVQVLGKPKKNYNLNEMIEYKVLVQPSDTSESLRMLSPVIESSNLELLNVRQESDEKIKAGQILTFIFQPKKAGKAEIRKLELRWRNSETDKSFDIEIPPLKLQITKPFLGSTWFWVLVGSLSIFLISIAAFFIISGRNKIHDETKTTTEPTLEDEAENALKNIRFKIGREEATVLLNQIQTILRHYLEKKIDWNSSRNGYDTFIEKATVVWTKPDAKKVVELLKSLENYRFSGVEIKVSDVRNLCDEFAFLISKNKIVTPFNTN